MSSLKNSLFRPFGTISLQTRGAIARATINNPPINILDHKLLSDLHGIKVLVFSSANPKFSVAHYDLHIFSPELPLSAPLNGEDVSQLYVEAVPFGAGNELLMQMDVRFASPDTKLGSLEVGPGVFAGNGELQFMTKLLGRARALEHLLSSGTANAEEAERMGWINKSFSTVEAMQEHVTRLAERIATFPVAALTATKAGVTEQAPTEAALNNDLGRFGELASDPKTQSAVTEFLKRSEDQKEGEWELGLNHNLVELWPKGSS